MSVCTGCPSRRRGRMARGLPLQEVAALGEGEKAGGAEAPCGGEVAFFESDMAAFIDADGPTQGPGECVGSAGLVPAFLRPGCDGFSVFEIMDAVRRIFGEDFLGCETVSLGAGE